MGYEFHKSTVRLCQYPEIIPRFRAEQLADRETFKSNLRHLSSDFTAQMKHSIKLTCHCMRLMVFLCLFQPSAVPWAWDMDVDSSGFRYTINFTFLKKPPKILAYFSPPFVFLFISSAKKRFAHLLLRFDLLPPRWFVFLERAQNKTQSIPSEFLWWLQPQFLQPTI